MNKQFLIKLEDKREYLINHAQYKSLRWQMMRTFRFINLKWITGQPGFVNKKKIISVMEVEPIKTTVERKSYKGEKKWIITTI